MNGLLGQAKEREEFLKKQITLLQQKGEPDKQVLVGLQNQLFQAQDQVKDLELSLGRLQVQNNTLDRRNIGLQEQLQKLKSQEKTNKDKIDELTYKIENITKELEDAKNNQNISLEQKQQLETELKILIKDLENTELETIRLEYDKMNYENFYKFRVLNREEQIAFVDTMVDDTKKKYHGHHHLSALQELYKTKNQNVNKREQILSAIYDLFYDEDSQGNAFNEYVTNVYEKLEEVKSRKIPSDSAFQTPPNTPQTTQESPQP